MLKIVHTCHVFKNVYFDICKLERESFLSCSTLCVRVVSWTEKNQVKGNVFVNLQRVHQGYLRENLSRFLKARDWNVSKAHTMVIYYISQTLHYLILSDCSTESCLICVIHFQLLDCLRWRVDSGIDSILSVSYCSFPLFLGLSCKLCDTLGSWLLVSAETHCS